MSLTLLVDAKNPAVPLDLTILQEGIGGLTGMAPTVAVRDGGTLDTYLDWSDNTFKTAGWVLKYGALSEVERGHYQRTLNVLSLSIAGNKALVAEFHLDGGGNLKGSAHDVLLVSSLFSDVTLLRKGLTNRMDESPGNPGNLTLFDDNDTTPLLHWFLRDAAGGGIVAGVGAPARRSKTTIGP